MNNNINNRPAAQEDKNDALLKEGRNEEIQQSPFEQAKQKLAENPLHEEADAEQQHKEAMTERD